MNNLIRLYYKYNHWANLRILDTVARLTPEQYHAESDVSFGTIHNILTHTFAVQWLWLMRWQGTSPTEWPKGKDFTGLPELRSYYEQVEKDTQSFLATLTEEKLPAPLTYINTKGLEYTYPLWQLMLHQCNHATQHRSEVAFITSQWHVSPGNIDITIFLDEVGA